MKASIQPDSAWPQSAAITGIVPGTNGKHEHQ